MTPEDKKLISVMNKLYARTKADVVDWEPSEDPNIYAVKFADYSISIERVPEAENAPESFNFSIANSDGLVIQELDNNLAKKNGFADMKDLFDRARWTSMARWMTCSASLTNYPAKNRSEQQLTAR